MRYKSKLRAGDWVEVLSKEEILRTLDNKGMVDHLPFMPEMFQYCGRRLRVFKRAHKTCDPPNGLGGRRLKGAVHLQDIRCDGQGHGGCQALCLIFWKEAWLLKAEDNRRNETEPESQRRSAIDPRPKEEGCTEADVWAHCQAAPQPTSCNGPTYICQSTQLHDATGSWRWWDPRQYVEDVVSRNARLSEVLSAFLFFIYSHAAGAGIGLGSGMRWMYDRFQNLRGGPPYPWRTGKIPKGVATPSARLNLQPGEKVRVKSYSEILRTLDETMRNRGMYFDGEMVPFTDKSFHVHKRVEQIINEKTGKMMTLTSDAIILKNVTCQARYSKCRMFCSRSIFPFWREIWLERIGPGDHKV